MEWSEALNQAYKLVFRNTDTQDAEQDIALAKLASTAILVGFDSDWIAERLRSGNQASIRQALKLRLH